ncbi:MAG: nitrilase-related carbon-nitrogen hydrolase [Bryobacteraceae bacterium]
MKKNVKVAAVQMESAQGDKGANLATVRDLAAQAAAAGVEIAVFPECCLTGYWFLRRLSEPEMRDLAEPAFDGPCAVELLAMSRQLGMSIGAGLVEAGEDGRFYNTYLFAMPDGGIRRHRKIHAFESEFISAGSEFTVFDTPHGCRVAILICYDVNLLENVRISALAGADVILAPHQTGGCRTRNPHLMGVIERSVWDNRHADPQGIERELLGEKGRGWLMRWLPSRAHDNGVFLVFSNGVGVDDDEIRTGNAMVLDPYGRILAESHKADNDVVIAELDASLLADSTGRLWMQARRPELYEALTRRTGIERDMREVKFSE